MLNYRRVHGLLLSVAVYTLTITIFDPGILEANSQHQPSQPASLQDQGGFFIGTSPEWQLAVGTVAYFETSTPGPWAQLSQR